MSESLGYQDRQDSHNFWRECGQSDYEFQAVMERRRTEPRVSILMNHTDPSEFFQEVEQLKYA